MRAYRAALAAAPGDAEAASLMGLALVHCGRAAEALSFLNQAVAAEPEQMGFRFNLAEGLIAMKDCQQAETQLQFILARHPDNPQAWERLGDVALIREEVGTAASAWRRAFDLGPGLSPGLKLARQAFSESRLEDAETMVRRLADRFPAEAAVRALRCDCLAARRNWNGLETAAVAWSRTDPGQHAAWRALARAAFETGRYRDALAAFRQVLALPGGNADDLAAYAGLQLHAHEFEGAAATLDRAESLSPDHPGVLARRATLHMVFGRFDAALDCCRRCIAQDPENVPAYSTLGRVLKGRLASGEIAVLVRIAGQAHAALDARVSAAFTLADAHDARGDADAAFAAYAYAQALAIELDRQERRSYDPAASALRFQQLARLTAFDVSPVETHPPAGPRPVFIVGMPRSGTTLVESILGAHSRVYPCGERPAMRQILRAALELAAGGHAPDEKTLHTWAAASLRDLPELQGADLFTDKHPLNFEAIGLIARLFPAAAIIHVRRHPVETCLSIFRQEIGKAWTFARRLEHIGHFYSQYARLMTHWQQQLPGRILAIQYEELAGDFSVAARQLVESVGLDWEPQCLEFQRTERAIATFSTIEARGPVSVRNSRAGSYRRHLGPLIDALEAGGVDLTTGALTGKHGMHDPAAR